MNTRLGTALAVASISTFALAVDLGHIMAVGDSMTAGTAPAYSGWRGPADAHLHAGGHTYSWVGPRDGGTFASGQSAKFAAWGGWGLDHIMTGHPSNPSVGKLSDWLTAYNPDTVMFLAGGNDWWRWRNTWFDPITETVNTSTQAQIETYYRNHFGQMLDQVFASPDRILVWSSLVRGDTEASAGRREFEDYLYDLIGTMAGEARADGYDVRFVDNLTWVDPTLHLHPDGVHWSLAGAEEAGRRFAEAAVVPEPSMLLLAPLAALVLRRKRRAA